MPKSEFDKNFNSIINWYKKWAFIEKNMKIYKKDNPYFFVSVSLENDKNINNKLDTIRYMLEDPDDDNNYLFKKKYWVYSSHISLVELENKSKKKVKNINTKNIIVHRNNKIFEKDNELKISNNNLLYLIFGLNKKNKTGGRLYFGLGNLKGDKKEIIKDLKLNKKKQTFEFRYKGPWEDEDAKNGEIKVNDIWKIIFISETEFDKMENFVSQFDIVKIID
jgi:hypothetical protein